ERLPNSANRAGGEHRAKPLVHNRRLDTGKTRDLGERIEQEAGDPILRDGEDASVGRIGDFGGNGGIEHRDGEVRMSLPSKLARAPVVCWLAPCIPIPHGGALSKSTHWRYPVRSGGCGGRDAARKLHRRTPSVVDRPPRSTRNADAGDDARARAARTALSA